MEDFVADLDVDKDGKVGFSDFEKTVKKYLAKTESSAMNWLVDGLHDFEDQIRNCVNQFEQNLKGHIEDAILDSLKSNSGFMDEVIPILIAKTKKYIQTDPDVMNCLENAGKDYAWLQQKFISFDQNVKPLEKKLAEQVQWYNDNKILVLGVLGIAIILPYMAIIKYLFFN